MTRKPSEKLLTGRRALDDISQLQILRDWEWFDKQSKWALRVALAPEFTPTEFIPPRTEWYFAVEDRYPAGDIKLYPATHDGITATFQHQSLNRETDDSPWRTGDICVATNFRLFGRDGYDDEPKTAHERLHWLAQRAIEWLIAASQDDLVRPGEPFELPVVNFRNDEELAFVENDSRYEQWTKVPDQYGLCVAASNPAIPGWRIMKFQTKAGSLNSDWGTAIAETDDNGKQAMWIRCSKIPIVRPWRFPETWGELRTTLQALGVDFDHCCREASACGLRDGKRHFCLLGFPIPEMIGGPAHQLHWLACELPVLTSAFSKGGFTNDPNKLWSRDREVSFPSSCSIRWVKTENWDRQQVQTRGHFPDEFIAKKMALIGIGAVGSVLAELLVRGGVTKLALVDAERLRIGNLSRHTLTMTQLDHPKADSLTERLNLISPHATVRSIPSSLEKMDGPGRKDILDAEIVWDCTGSDDVFRTLETMPWPDHSILFSLSLSFGAGRLFLYSQGPPINFESFAEKLRPWLIRDRQEREERNEPLPREGIGCFHPVFPALAVDIHLLVALALKLAVESISISTPVLRVFEQVSQDGVTRGVQQVEG
jgi:hypothetical protein